MARGRRSGPGGADADHPERPCAQAHRRARPGRGRLKEVPDGLQGPDRELLWKLTDGWPPKTLPADTLDDLSVRHLRANDLVEVVDGKVRATQVGYDLRALIENREL